MLHDRLASFFELQDPAKARWLSMEGLRGIAVILVFFVHYSSGMTPYFGGGDDNIWWIVAIREIGNSGVDLFFVLSGFLIYRAVVRRPLNHLQYAYRRLERIYPVFLTVLGIYLLLSHLFPAQSRIPTDMQAAATYITANVLLLPGIFDIEPIITVAWSLSYEALYYILVPLVVGILAMRKWQWQHRAIFFLAFYLGCIFSQMLDPTTYFRLTMFLGGILLYEVSQGMEFKKGPAKKPWIDWLSLTLLVAGLASFTLLGESRWMLGDTVLADIPPYFKFVILNGVFVLLVHRCIFASGTAARLFAFRPLRWLGNMSYTYYLMHSLGLHFFFRALPIVAPSLEGSVLIYVGLIPLALIATIVASLPVYMLIEYPFSLKPSTAARLEPSAETAGESALPK